MDPTAEMNSKAELLAALGRRSSSGLMHNIWLSRTDKLKQPDKHKRTRQLVK
jgi:hypothetical protein